MLLRLWLAVFAVATGLWAQPPACEALGRLTIEPPGHVGRKVVEALVVQQGKLGERHVRSYYPLLDGQVRDLCSLTKAGLEFRMDSIVYDDHEVEGPDVYGVIERSKERVSAYELLIREIEGCEGDLDFLRARLESIEHEQRLIQESFEPPNHPAQERRAAAFFGLQSIGKGQSHEEMLRGFKGYVGKLRREVLFRRGAKEN